LKFLDIGEVFCFGSCVLGKGDFGGYIWQRWMFFGMRRSWEGLLERGEIHGDLGSTSYTL
jgi:hypothetical protein